MNKNTILIISLVLLNFLTSCTNNQDEKLKSINKNEEMIYSDIEKETLNTDKKENINEDVSIIKGEIIKELVIDKNCIWCGKCTIIAPTNFTMDYNTLKAVVISQKNMFSQEVTTSVQVCPTDSIHII